MNMKEEKMLEVSHAALRHLLFWAGVGVESSRGGSHSEIPTVIEYLAEKIGMKKSQFVGGKFPEFKNK